jgi:hypothetical protein
MWKLTNRQFAEKTFNLFVFVDGDRIAVADHSIDNMSDPSSTDDGLLLVDDTRPVVSAKPMLFCEGNYLIPVITDKGEQSTVIAPLRIVNLIRRIKENRLAELGWLSAERAVL